MVRTSTGRKGTVGVCWQLVYILACLTLLAWTSSLSSLLLLSISCRCLDSSLSLDCSSLEGQRGKKLKVSRSRGEGEGIEKWEERSETERDRSARRGAEVSMGGDTCTH